MTVNRNVHIVEEVDQVLTLFFGLMVRAYVRGETIDCGCFGPGEAISPLTLLRDGALLGGAILMASDATDITRAFINDFNSKNPATAAMAPPPK